MLTYTIKSNDALKNSFITELPEKLKNEYIRQSGKNQAKADNAINSIDLEKLFKLLSKYQECYYSSLEYFSSYQTMMAAQELGLLKRGLAGEWIFLANAVFDEGANCLYSFYDKQITKDRDAPLLRSIYDETKQIIAIASFDTKNPAINNLIKYRGSCSAHMGINQEQNRIRFSTPWIVLESIRRGGEKFWGTFFPIQRDFFAKKELERMLEKKAQFTAYFLGIKSSDLILEKTQEKVESFINNETKTQETIINSYKTDFSKLI